MRLKEFVSKLKDYNHLTLLKYNSTDVLSNVYGNSLILKYDVSTSKLIEYLENSEKYNDFYVFLVAKFPLGPKDSSTIKTILDTKENVGNNNILYYIYISECFENHQYDR